MAILQQNINNIEIRSEKARNIIGQVPPIIIRFGITIFFILICSFLIFCCTWKYSPIIKTTALIKVDSNIAILNIPANELSQINKGNEIQIIVNNVSNLNTFQFQSKIILISDYIIVENNKAFYKAQVKLPESILFNNQNPIKLSNDIIVDATIRLNQTTLFNKMLLFFRTK